MVLNLKAWAVLEGSQGAVLGHRADTLAVSARSVYRFVSGLICCPADIESGAGDGAI